MIPTTTRATIFEVISNSAHIEHVPIDRDLAQWHQSIGVARQACARIFRDGGSASDAIRTFGLDPNGAGAIDWSRAVSLIAQSLSMQRVKRAA